MTPKQKRLVQNLPNTKTQNEALVKAGYSLQTADKVGKDIISRAIKATEIEAMGGNKEADRLLTVLGISREEYQERLKEIAMKSQHHSVVLTLLSPVLKSQGYDIEGDNKASLPPINIGIIETKATDKGITADVIELPMS